MEQQDQNTVVAQLRRLASIPGLAQLFLLVGIAGAVAVGMTLFLWMGAPGYQTLFAGLEQADTAEVVEALQANAIPFKLHEDTGAVMVPGDQLHNARMQLAAQGLPQGTDMGIEYLRENPGLSVSRFMESARYHHVLETELARTIASLRPVRSARVHLAVPERSAFVRQERAASASVVLELFAGRALASHQVASVVHLVASSIPNIDTGDVTVVDQQGRLLSSTGGPEHLAFSEQNFEHTRRLEETYARRIKDLLAPLVGRERFEVQISAAVDFTQIEQTEETFDPDAVLRSEQISEEQRSGGPAAGGVPGALSNQPPGAGDEAATAATNTNSARRSVRNFEVDKTISHTRRPVGSLERLSVAVLLDNKQTVDAEGAAQSEPYSDAEIAAITALVREAVGFDAERGDTIQVINAAFRAQTPMPEATTPWWQQKRWHSLARQVASAVVLLLVALLVLRPLVRGLLMSLPAPPARPALLPAANEAGASASDGATLTELHKSDPAQPAALPGVADFEQSLNRARSIVEQDPKRVAKIVREWVGEPG